MTTLEALTAWDSQVFEGPRSALDCEIEAAAETVDRFLADYSPEWRFECARILVIAAMRRRLAASGIWGD